MTRARIIQEMRSMWFEARYERQQRRDVTMAEAAEMLGVMERTFHRWIGRYDGRAPWGYRIDGLAGFRAAECRSRRRCA